MIQEVYLFLSKGGWLMIPIGICSIIALGLFFERMWSLQRSKVIPERFFMMISKHIKERRFQEAEAMCEGNDSHLAAILLAGLRYAGRDRSVIKEVMEEAGQREIHFMERFLGAIGAIATISPLLGLLGTVTGMITVFQRVVTQAAAGTPADPGGLANGIWEALITTAAGLTVAIPTYLAYRYIEGRIDRFSIEMVDLSLSAAEYMVPEEQSPTSLSRDAIKLTSPESSESE